MVVPVLALRRVMSAQKNARGQGRARPSVFDLPCVGPAGFDLLI